MKPSDTYAYLKHPSFLPDFSSLAKAYQPILGMEATSLYQYLYAFYDYGYGRHSFGSILNHLDFGTQALERAFDFLLAMQLIELYQADSTYQVRLLPPLSLENFLNTPLYRSLLIKKIGETAVDLLAKSDYTDKAALSKSFADVFSMDGEPDLSRPKTVDFDVENFKSLMAKDLLRFQQEYEDLLALHHLAVTYRLTWFSLYQVAKKTAVDSIIVPKRIEQQLKANQSLKSSTSFTKEEAALLRLSKQHTALDVLGQIKKDRKASITASEQRVLKELADMGLLDEVINVILIYTFNQVDSANLNEKYAIKVANDFSYRGIVSAELAIEALRSNHKAQPVKHQQKKPEKSNVPEWSNPDYKNETTPERRAELEERKRQLLERMNKGGD